MHPRRPRWNWCDRKTPAARSADRNDRPGLFSAARQAGLCIAKQNSPLQPPSTAFRVTSGAAEVGAGWNSVSANGEPYISLKLDDPSFNAPINAALWPAEKEGDYVLVWSRPNREAA